MGPRCVYCGAENEFLGAVYVHFWFLSVKGVTQFEGEWQQGGEENVGAREGIGDSSMIVV
jgi:hypothetical protein